MFMSMLLKRLIVHGKLTVIDAAGKTQVFEGASGPEITIRLHDRSVERQLALQPTLAFGEAYMHGRLTVEDGSLYDFLDLAGANLALSHANILMRARVYIERWLRRVTEFNTIGRARRNAEHHYDLSGDLYDLFLDRDHQYSCAYFVNPDDDLETAQEQKKRHIAAKLVLRPGHRVLDIGSGWGGLGLYLAGQTGAHVTGVTLSTEQHKVSQQRAAEMKLDHQVQFFLHDYRHETTPYDRIVSVGMFEHVGQRHYDEFFTKIHTLLKPDGVALLHTIGESGADGVLHQFIHKYIFPGTYIPALSDIVPPIERTGLVIADVEVLRLHYANTLRAWRERFLANWDRAKALYDEVFCRMWEYYLAGCEVGFRRLGLVVFQIQIARRQDAVPITRDYIADFEHGGRSQTTQAA